MAAPNGGRGGRRLLGNRARRGGAILLGIAGEAADGVEPVLANDLLPCTADCRPPLLSLPPIGRRAREPLARTTAAMVLHHFSVEGVVAFGGGGVAVRERRKLTTMAFCAGLNFPYHTTVTRMSPRSTAPPW
ncbi:hypothetical protein OsI_17383 [Oryza sativa Indica Group]|uniref:Uncharacterized protein n=1 Tax=Oryza sativa subsp. indica TaxID=39946 RepID=B8AU57_ORYSI|nr:hypothetical protein OsI_17383 [Oryza sativa Indica Group]